VTQLDRISARAERRHVPLSVQIELTGRCNLDCQHCYLDIHHPPRDEMTSEEVRGVLAQLRRAGTFFLTLTGGEMFLRPDALEIAAEARRLGFALRLFTSGTRLGRREADAIAQLGVMSVELSLYSHRAAAHDAITRRPGSHRRTLRAALLLRRRGVHVVLKAPLMRPTGSDYPGLLALGERLGVPFKLDPSLIARRDGNRTPLALRAVPQVLVDALRDPRVSQLEQLPPPADPNQAPCAIARRTCRIGPNGDVFPCHTFPIPAGNLRRQSFAEIWSSSPLLARLRAIRFGDLGPSCSGCAKSGYCGRCMGLALIEHGDMLGPSAEACRIAEAKERALGLDLPPAPGPARGPRRLPVVG
jgi:radical SAM protein with 4Fe4S-binding SPASM domain